MASRNNIFTTIRTEGALLPADLLQRISEGANLDGLTPESYHRPGEKLNEAINRSWNALQGAWASFRAAQERLPESDLGTTITRERWLLPLFRELDYGRLQTVTAAEIGGRSYPISHGWEHVPIHLVSYKLELDRRTPGAAGAASASPHSLLQVFLNRSDANLWGFVSNGYKLRILRDNVSLTRQAYVEFDLEAMMEGEVYSDFVLLWLLGHQSRLEGERPSDCWLEKWMKVAEDQGTRALDQLRDGVEQAIEALGLGFLEYHANAQLRDKLTSGELNAQDYYRQLLRMVYRLLFLFVAEDRELLLNPDAPQEARERYIKHYSTQRLRHMAERFKGTRHPDLFESLRLVMRLLSGESAPTPGPSPSGGGERQVSPHEGERFRVGAAGLGLIPLGSFLFSDRAVTDIIDCQISNQHLLTAVRALSLTYDQRAQVYRTVDYKNLGSDELGSIFESLLELHPQINVPARRFALSTAAGNERKTTGSYYTPESLVHALLDSALNPVLEEATKKGEEAVLALKICDPACGSGHFLIAAANRIAKKLAEVRTGEEEPPPAAIQEAKRDVISHCIYGVDINPMAVELCKVNLWMEALEPGKPLNFLDHRIQVGNSLLGTTPKLMAGGIPDDAFSPIEGDDPKYATTLKKVNKQERKAHETKQRRLEDALPANYAYLTEAMHALDDAPDDTLEGIRRKEAQYAALANDPEYIKARLLADAWCAAFVWEKRPPKAPTPGPSPSGGGETARGSEVLPHEGEGFRMGARGAGEGYFPLPMTDLLYRRMEKDPLAENLQTVRRYVVQLKERYQFFHWHVAFPDVFSVDIPHPPTPSPSGRRGEQVPPPEGEGFRVGAYNPQTGWHGGFDCVLGNPPWDQIQLDDREFFAVTAPEIAGAANMTARKKMISKLSKSDPHLHDAYLQAVRANDGVKHFAHASGRFPFTSFGRLNTAPLFCELGLHVISSKGYSALIVPTGIATDSFNQHFFNRIVDTRALSSLYDFENRAGLFPAVDSRMKFCLLILNGPARQSAQMQFAFFAHDVSDLAEVTFTLSPEDIALLNPNTRTTPIFRTKRDADLTKSIYQRVPILIREGESEENPWGIKFQLMFMMNTDSDKFRTRDELESAGYTLLGNHFVRQLRPDELAAQHQPRLLSDRPEQFSLFGKPSPQTPLPQGEGLTESRYLPLYEGRMIHHYDHRVASMGVNEENTFRSGVTLETDLEQHQNSSYLVQPRYWVDLQDVERATSKHTNRWMIALKDVTSATNERTAIFSAIPFSAVGHKLPLILPNGDYIFSSFIGNLSAYVFDFVSRQKVGGVSLGYFILKQLPIIPPHTYTPALLDFIVPRVLELTYTAWDLQPFAQDVGYDGPPFIWDEERRFLMRCELDALYFHLYQIRRDDVDYIMETFPIVKRKDEAAHGEYLTKRIILEMYDQMAGLSLTPVPAPKSPHPPAPSPSGRGGEKVPPPEGEGFRVGVDYLVPDVRQWVTWLNPGPADASVAHPERD